MKMKDFAPGDIASRDFYKIMTATIAPRPIAWVSTIDEAGVANLAPFSFFNAVSGNPPTLLFCSGARAGAVKDTWYNIEATGEFVVNVVTEALGGPMNLTATDLPADVDEFDYANLEKLPSTVVRPPRVAASPVHFECRLQQIVPIGGNPPTSAIIIGDIVQLHIAADLLDENYRVDMAALQLLGRHAGNSYSRSTDFIELIRPPSQLG
ncbi:MAG: flavin reductase family protein [Anaerolineales bacterium]|nr:flavin reductase family protein [Anaerolineales bacterium]MCB0030109.1 flavin reductase family protein [Anaerolineales bacterium]